MHQRMALYCHGLVPSAADTKIQYTRQCTKQTDNVSIQIQSLMLKEKVVYLFHAAAFNNTACLLLRRHVDRLQIDC